MQHIPLPKNAQRAARQLRDNEPRYETEEHRVEEEPDATSEWLAHVAAGRIPRPEPVEGKVR